MKINQVTQGTECSIETSRNEYSIRETYKGELIVEIKLGQIHIDKLGDRAVALRERRRGDD